MLSIQQESPLSKDVIALLKAHHQEMHLYSPPESVHALDENALHSPDIVFWSARDAQHLAGCGALKQLDKAHGEIKSMRTDSRYLRQGVARQILQVILHEATQRGYSRVSLETGTMQAFAPARAMYHTFGFKTCAPFANYFDDPNSVCMTLKL